MCTVHCNVHCEEKRDVFHCFDLPSVMYNSRFWPQNRRNR